MALFKTIDLIAYKQRLELQLANMPLALVFTDNEKEHITLLYNELIATCNTAIARNHEKEKR